MTRFRGLVRAVLAPALAALLVATVAVMAAAAQAPALPAAPKGAPQDSGALRVQVLGSLSEAQKNDPVLEDKTKTVASELRCPVCQGLSIQDSPSELSQQMRSTPGRHDAPPAAGGGLVRAEGLTGRGSN